MQPENAQSDVKPEPPKRPFGRIKRVLPKQPLKPPTLKTAGPRSFSFMPGLANGPAAAQSWHSQPPPEGAARRSEGLKRPRLPRPVLSDSNLGVKHENKGLGEKAPWQREKERGPAPKTVKSGERENFSVCYWEQPAAGAEAAPERNGKRDLFGKVNKTAAPKGGAKARVSVFSELVANKVLEPPGPENDFVAGSGQSKPEDRQFSHDLLQKPLINTKFDVSRASMVERLLYYGLPLARQLPEHFKRDINCLSVSMQLQMHDEWRQIERSRFTRLLLAEKAEADRQRHQKQLGAVFQSAAKKKAFSAEEPFAFFAGAKAFGAEPSNKRKRNRKTRNCVKCQSPRLQSQLIRCVSCDNVIHSHCAAGVLQRAVAGASSWACSPACRERQPSQAPPRKDRLEPRSKVVDPKRLWDELEDFFRADLLLAALPQLKAGRPLAKAGAENALGNSSATAAAHIKAAASEGTAPAADTKEATDRDSWRKADTKVAEKAGDGLLSLLCRSMLRRRAGEETAKDEDRKTLRNVRSLAQKYCEKEGVEPLAERPYVAMRSLRSDFALAKGFVVSPGDSFIFPPQKYLTDPDGGFVQIQRTLQSYDLLLEAAGADGAKSGAAGVEIKMADGLPPPSKKAKKKAERRRMDKNKGGVQAAESFGLAVRRGPAASEVEMELRLLRKELAAQAAHNDAANRKLATAVEQRISSAKTFTESNRRSDDPARLMAEYEQRHNKKVF